MNMPFASDPTVTTQRQMTKIRCDSCGVDAEVPFVPDGKRNVYCPLCWKAKRDAKRAEASERLKKLTRSGYYAEPAVLGQ